MDENGFEQYQKPRSRNGYGLASLIFGIAALGGLALFASPLTGLLSIIFGAVQIKRTPENKTMALAGMIMGVLGIIITIVVYSIILGGILPSSEQEIMEFYRNLPLQEI